MGGTRRDRGRGAIARRRCGRRQASDGAAERASVRAAPMRWPTLPAGDVATEKVAGR